MDRRHEDLADDSGRREAELAEWRRIVQLLAVHDGPYDPDTDAVVQEELAADRHRKEAEQQCLQEQQQIAGRADESPPTAVRSDTPRKPGPAAG
ncbi:hypothetical protein PV396_43925 [Streptomyces sp. ME02-8801-2C]|uniref:hypothetical protein n=1 Tax=Streptomyces sp. ME02-8801-2C TaxID=3028680 RepID=UPI0029A97743|nr:hypothetical protein [Streptomyces sp. ME02-8801-2C]MDX3458794.1 hypothetical protein [Streptomyces sp. ME02-8801-2C]